MVTSSKKAKNDEKKQNQKPKKLPRHIAVMRLSAMGDVAMMAHALRAFVEAYSDVRVTVVTRKLFVPFFEGLGVEVLEVDTKSRHKGIKGLWRLFGDIRRGRKIDAFADLHSSVRSRVIRWLMRLSGRKVASIHKGRVEKWFRVGYNSHNGVPLKHTVVRYCDVLRELGFEFDDPTPVLREQSVKRENPMGEKKGRWIGFAPFSAHTGKTYPEDMSRQLVELLAADYERVFIHSGGGSEAEFAQQMEAKYANVVALNGKVKLAGELNLIAHLDCVVSMDSLVMHMASLTGTPVVSVWGATHPALGFLGWGYDERNVLQADMPCRPCSVYGDKECKTGDYKCLRAITPQMVADKVKEMVAG